MKHRQIYGRFFILAVVAFGLLCAASACHSARVESSTIIGALEYPTDKELLRNPWLRLAGTGWPSMSSEEVAKLASTPSTKEKDHFSHWVRETMSEDWLPSDFQHVPFLTGNGFIHVKQASDYRIRVSYHQKVCKLLS